MNVDDIYGTLYSPTDGTIDPTGMCEALTRSAKKAGLKVKIGQSPTIRQMISITPFLMSSEDLLKYFNLFFLTF